MYALLCAASSRFPTPGPTISPHGSRLWRTIERPAVLLQSPVESGRGPSSGRQMSPQRRFLLFLVLAPTLLAQGQRRVFSKIFTGEPYTIECYLPQITNGPNFPSWSPDGKEIAFAMKGSIWRIRLGETTAHELTMDNGYASMPAWSPDGRWIAYTSDSNEQIHLKLLDTRTGAVSRLTSGNSINVEP